MHTPTLVLMAVILTGAMTLMMLAAWRFNRRTPALAHWAMAYCFAFLFSLTLLLQRFIPEIVAILLSQTLLAGMAYCNLTGAQTYTSRRLLPWPAALAALALLLISTVSFKLLQSDPFLRYWLSSTMVGALFVLSATVMAPRQISLHPARALYATVCVIHGFFVLIRPWLFHLGNGGVFNQERIISVSQFVALESTIAIVLLALCVIMLSSEYMMLELKQIAEHDALTGVFNRRAFLTLLDKHAAQQARLHKPLSILLLDLDHFKHINDQAGHKTGDKALRHFIRIAQGCVREGDVLGRIGGEEFAICLPDAGLTEAQNIAQRLRSSLESQAMPHKHSVIRITASIGIACKLANETAETALHRADKAMYRAKFNGRNRVEIATDEDATVLIASA